MTTLLEVSGGKFSSACVGLEVLQTLPENIFDLCENDPAALHSLIALIMSVQSTVNVLHAAESESSALEILRSRISASTTAEHSDETMMTVFLLSRLEVCSQYQVLIDLLTLYSAFSFKQRYRWLSRSCPESYDPR